MSAQSSWQLADVHVSAGKGANTSLLTSCDYLGGKVVFVGETPCEAPFGPQNFDKDPLAVRQHLELRLTPEQDTYFKSVDAWAINYLVASAERLFKKKMSLEQIKEQYHSPIKRNEKYEPLLRTKITTSGTWATKYWTPDGKEAAAPVTWRGATFKPRLHLSHLWIMGTSCGIAINVTDLQVEDEPICQCPF
jgi:hypothetical protein